VPAERVSLLCSGVQMYGRRQPNCSAALLCEIAPSGSRDAATTSERSMGHLSTTGGGGRMIRFTLPQRVEDGSSETNAQLHGPETSPAETAPTGGETDPTRKGGA